MIHEKPLFRIGGDSFVTVELGDDGSLRLNLFILTLEKKIWGARFPWLIDTTSLRTTIMVHYDPFIARANQVIEEIKSIISQGVRIPAAFPSKTVTLPVYYNDPWTRECARAFGMPPNLEMIARENNLSTSEVIRIHSDPDYFVSYTSFMYGSFGAFPIGGFRVLMNSKYAIPRKWTPPGTLGIGGTTTTYYSILSPGGLMMLGNIPVPTFDFDCRNARFREDPLLIRPGDRLRFIPIEGGEYDRLKRSNDEYDYEIEEGFIELRNYEGM
jgi:urea carboxylase